jgi:hypothetical protein
VVSGQWPLLGWFPGCGGGNNMRVEVYIKLEMVNREWYGEAFIEVLANVCVVVYKVIVAKFQHGSLGTKQPNKPLRTHRNCWIRKQNCIANKHR